MPRMPALRVSDLSVIVPQVLLLLLAQVPASVTSSPDDVTCQQASSCVSYGKLVPGPLSATVPEYVEDYERSDRYYAYDCCGQGFTSIGWSKRGMERREHPYPWGSGTLCQEQQTLVFPALRESDTGFYTATLSNGTHLLKRHLILRVSPLAKPTGQVIPYRVPDQPQVAAALGDNVSFPCSGHFGPGEGAYQMLEWLYANGSEGFEFVPENVHFKIQEFGYGNTTMRGKTLTIVGVRKEDYQLVFQCVMATAIEGNDFSFTVRLVPPEWIPTQKTILVICASAGVVFILAIVSVSVYCHHRQFCHYHGARLCGLLKPRGNCKFDIFLLSKEFNLEFSRETLYEKLQSLGYHVCEYHHQALGNKQELDQQAEFMKQSVCTLMVCSVEDLDDHCYDTLVTLAALNAFSVVVVQLDKSEDLRAHLKELGKDQQQNMRKAFSLFHFVAWPGEGDKRGVENFWYCLRRRLPKPSPCPRGRLTSSEQPLMCETTEEDHVRSRAFNQQISNDSGFSSLPQAQSPVEHV